MVILMGAFVLHGIQPGRDLLVNRLDIVWAIILGVIAAQVLTTIIILGGGAWLARISLVPVKYIAPFVAILSFIGVYAVRSNIWDVALAVFAALVGFSMRRAGFPLITLVIGFVLGQLAEEKFTQSLQISGGRLLDILHAAGLHHPAARHLLHARLVHVQGSEEEPRPAGGRVMTRINGFNLGVYAFLLTIALSIVLGATAYAGKQQLTAFVIGIPTITLLIFLVLAEVTPRS